MGTSTKIILRKRESGHCYALANPKRKISNSHAPLVFIHGAGGGAWHWDHLLPYFASRGFVCYAPDIIGHGESEKDIQAASVHDYVADMRHFLKHVVLPHHKQRAIVIGHSMGGLIAQKIAEGGGVGGAVLVTPMPPQSISYTPLGLPALTPMDLFSALFSLCVPGIQFSPSREFVESLFADPVASTSVIDTLAGSRYCESPRALKEMLWSEIAVEPRMITVPMAVVEAEKDVVVGQGVTGAIARYYQVPRVCVRNLGHMCIMEAGWGGVAGGINSCLIKHIKC